MVITKVMLPLTCRYNLKNATLRSVFVKVMKKSLRPWIGFSSSQCITVSGLIKHYTHKRRRSENLNWNGIKSIPNSDKRWPMKSKTQNLGFRIHRSFLLVISLRRTIWFLIFYVPWPGLTNSEITYNIHYLMRWVSIYALMIEKSTTFLIG